MWECFCELLWMIAWTVAFLLQQATSMHSTELFFEQSEIYRATEKLQLKKTTFLIWSSYSLPLWLSAQAVYQAMHMSTHFAYWMLHNHSMVIYFVDSLKVDYSMEVCRRLSFISISTFLGGANPDIFFMLNNSPFSIRSCVGYYLWGRRGRWENAVMTKLIIHILEECDDNFTHKNSTILPFSSNL